MFRIRFHGRGGQGMKTAANLLGAAFFEEGWEAQDAPRYGAERRGAPIFAYVRASRAPIQERGIITAPGLVVVADETLMTLAAAGVMQGVGDATVMLLDSGDAAGWRERLPQVNVLAMPRIAATVAHPRVPATSAVCAGAAARLCGVISREALAAAVSREFGARERDVAEHDLRCALAAYDAMAPHAGTVTRAGVPDVTTAAAPQWIAVPRDDVLLAVPGIHSPASSERSLTGAWRTLRPVIDYEHCNRCSWICGTLCPDSAIRVDADRTPRIDYDHCKGCLVCVAVCPPHAIRGEPELAGALR